MHFAFSMFASIKDGRVVCALPGNYSESIQIPSGDNNIIIGLGQCKVDQAPGSMHSLFVHSNATAYVSGLQFFGGNPKTSQACIVVCSQSTVIDNCHVNKYAGAGVLIADMEAAATVRNCSFRNARSMAIEVREGGALTCTNVRISDCRQGIVAYGGAKRVTLQDCKIEKCQREGVLLSGTFVNAATAAQDSVGRGHSSAGTTARKVSEEAHAWGRARGIQLVSSLSAIEIKKCGNFGISVDYGAHAVIHACTMNDNDPCSILIKGGCDVSVAACIIEYNDSTSKASLTKGIEKVQKRKGSRAKKKVETLAQQSGILIGANYNGNITITACSTVGYNSELGIVDEFNSNPNHDSPNLFGLYTKPAVLSGNLHFQPNSRNVPCIEELSRMLPCSSSINVGASRKATIQPEDLALRRHCRPFRRSSWSPTANQYYAIGNTFGYDIASDVALEPAQPLRFLLGACGDIRNVVETVANSGSRGVSTMEFVMNDGNVAMLARNAVLLHMIANEAPSDSVLAVWANHGLTDAQSDTMCSSIVALAEERWPNWLAACSNFSTATKSSQTHSVAHLENV